MVAKIVRFCVFLIAALCLLSACSDSEPYQSPDPVEVDSPEEATPPVEAAPAPVRQGGFDSPEDAVAAYLEGLRDMDLDRMIDAFAIEAVKHFNMEAHLDWIGVYQPTREMPLPNANELTTAMNIEMRRGEVVYMIRTQYLILSQFDFAMQRVEAGEIDDFIRDMNAALNAPELHTLRILGFIPPETIERYDTESNQDNMARNARVSGAEQVVSRIAVFELGGNKGVLFVDAVEYGGRWYIGTFGGNAATLAGIPFHVHGLVVFPPEYMDEFLEEFAASIITDW